VVRRGEALDSGEPDGEGEGQGQAAARQAQLRIDESRRWLRVALQLADEGEEGAVAAIMTLLMNMRCSEIVNRAALRAADRLGDQRALA
jgi:hypothetical protein